MLRSGISRAIALAICFQTLLTSCGSGPTQIETGQNEWSKRLEDSIVAGQKKLKEFDSMARIAGIPTEEAALDRLIDTIFSDPRRKAEAADVYDAYKRRLTSSDLAILETLEEFTMTGDRELFEKLKKSLQEKDMPTFDPRIIRYLESRFKQ